MAKPAKIALTGKFRSGKSTAEAYLGSHYHMRSFAFADELKTAFHRAFPNVPRNPKPRAFYQKFGEWACETFGERVWVDKVFEAVGRFEQRSDASILITDLRKPVEYQALKEAGYVIIRIEAADDLRIKRAIQEGDEFDETSLTHSSELYIDKITPDYTVFNNLDPSSMVEQLDYVMEEIGVVYGINGGCSR